MERGANIHVNEEWALRLASKNGHLDVVRFLVEKGANGLLEIVQFLVDSGASINVCNDSVEK